MPEPAGAVLHGGFLAGADDDDARAQWLDDQLTGLSPRIYPHMDAVNAWVAMAASRQDLVQAGDLAREVGCTLRTLQRRLRRFVGVGPKAVIRRFRLQQAAARLAQGESVDQTDLALSLGYFDQSHFVRDFRRAVGIPPAAYGTLQGE